MSLRTTLVGALVALCACAGCRQDTTAAEREALRAEVAQLRAANAEQAKQVEALRAEVERLRTECERLKSAKVAEQVAKPPAPALPRDDVKRYSLEELAVAPEQELRKRTGAKVFAQNLLASKIQPSNTDGGDYDVELLGDVEGTGTDGRTHWITVHLSFRLDEQRALRLSSLPRTELGKIAARFSIVADIESVTIKEGELPKGFEGFTGWRREIWIAVSHVSGL